jgi:uncharacterized membrane protein
MELPAITLPKIDLPFDIPVLIHPAVDHFAIALPVVILLLEFYNLFARKKSIGGFSFILIFFTIIIFALAYLSGGIDGKETYELLSPEGQTELKAHKLLGTYLLFISLGILILKLLSMTGKLFFKFLFFIGLIGFILVTFKQGEEGGELVYKYGANVEKVKTLDEELFDAKEELEDTKTEKEEVVEAAVTTPQATKPQTNEAKDVVEEESVKVIEEPKTETITETSSQQTEEVKDTDEKTVSKEVEEKVTDTTKRIDTLLENAKKELKKADDAVNAIQEQ